MKRHHVIWLVVGAAAIALVVWIMRNTYWDEFTLPTSLRNEAARNPYYAAESLARKLGATTFRDSAFPAPAPTAVIFLDEWSWELGDSRRRQIERWVQSGGRLVVSESVHFTKQVFREWSGIEYYDPDISKEETKRRASEDVERCVDWTQSGSAPIAGDDVDRTYWICDQDVGERLRASRAVGWALRDRDGMLALRVAAGKGSVTVFSGDPFKRRALLAGDHAELLVALTQLRSGDQLYFLSEASHPSLATLAWRHGAPAILLAMLALLFALWRNGMRFGPLMPAPHPLRRSLVEQIRGTGEFTLRYGGGGALHAALVRAARDAALRRIPGFAGLDSAGQAAAMAQAAAVSVDNMVAALDTAAQRPRSLLSTLALLESVRRRILSIHPGHINGK